MSMWNGNIEFWHILFFLLLTQCDIKHVMSFELDNQIRTTKWRKIKSKPKLRWNLELSKEFNVNHKKKNEKNLNQMWITGYLNYFSISYFICKCVLCREEHKSQIITTTQNNNNNKKKKKTGTKILENCSPDLWHSNRIVYLYIKHVLILVHCRFNSKYVYV